MHPIPSLITLQHSVCTTSVEVNSFISCR